MTDKPSDDTADQDQASHSRSQRDLEPIDDFGDLEREEDDSTPYTSSEDEDFDDFGELEDEDIELVDVSTSDNIDTGQVDNGDWDDVDDEFDDDDEDPWPDNDSDDEQVELSQASFTNKQQGDSDHSDQAPPSAAHNSGNGEPITNSSHSPAGLPWGLIVVGVLALLLVAGGGYGVVQDRTALQQQIRGLQAELGTAASPLEVQEMRKSLATAQSRNSKLEATIQTLNIDNNTLTSSMAGLEQQLDSLTRELDAKQATPATAAVIPRTKIAASPSSTGPRKVTGWFVNFGTYGRQAQAQDWATRLEVKYGRVIVAPLQRNGDTLYRVRVVGLADKAEAQQTATDLEQRYKLPKLWLGKE